MYKLLSFTVENFRSFCAAQTISFDGGEKHCVTAIFGPNAGGKSNIVRALATFVECVRASSGADWRLPYDPFLLKTGMDAQPASFSVDFLFNDRRYVYGFSYLPDRVVREELKEESSSTGRMNKVFERTEEGLNPYARQFGFGKRLLERTRAETLLITKGREENNEYSNIVFGLLECIVVIGPGAGRRAPDFVEMLKRNAKLKKKTLELLRSCDFSIRDIRIDDASFATVHALRDGERTVVDYRTLDFWDQESMGTQKFFEVAVPILDALEGGKCIFIDEFATYIHPTLSDAVLSLFDCEKAGEAYMVLTTHDTALLKGLSRSEIVFVEKDHAEESLICSLGSLGVREGEAFEKRYLAGLYGALPIIEW